MIRFILPKKVIQEARNTVTINNGASIKRLVHYHVDNTDALKSTHELAKNNPLLKKMWKNSTVNNTFQHPTIGRITCEEPSCSNKICKKVCSSETERVYVGHVIHSNYPGSVFLSEKDFTGQNRLQYGLFYDKPVVNPDTQGNNTNQTNELNNADVSEKLNSLFRAQVVPKFGTPMEEYKGVGITNEKIQKILYWAEEDKKQQALKDFQKYKQIKNQKGTLAIQEWLEKKEKVEPSVYKHLKILIEEYENKFK